MSVAPTVATVPAEPLAPVREALLADARGDADRIFAEADADVEAVRRRTAEECDRIRREARSRGAADAEEMAAAERARARRQARAVVLRARGRAYDGLRRQVRDAAVALAGSADYPELRARLVEQARALVGDSARVSETADGTVVAEDGGRRAVLSLAVVAERLLDRMGPDLEGLWAP